MDNGSQAKENTVVVFGGTGFLGRRVVRHLRAHEVSVRIASRHPDRDYELFGRDDPNLQSVGANIHNERSVADALVGAYGVVNAVSLYVEQGQETFQSVHVESARLIAARARQAGVQRLVHVSGIGSDAGSPSLYIRKRGEGELAVRGAFADAILIRPAVMVGPDDSFLTTILKLLRFPIYPMFGRGRTRLQPAYVEDVAEGIARALQGSAKNAVTFECGGPRVYSYEDLLRTPSPPETAVDPSSVCRLARDSWGRGTVPEPARHAESGGADAGGQRDIAGDARICRACNHATLGRGNPAGDLIGRTL